MIDYIHYGVAFIGSISAMALFDAVKNLLVG